MFDDDEIIGEDIDPTVVMTNDELAEEYLRNWNSIKDTPEQLGLDEDYLRLRYWDVYDDWDNYDNWDNE